MPMLCQVAVWDGRGRIGSMSEPRVRRIEARPVTPEVEEYRTLSGLAVTPVPDSPEAAARELVRLSRFRGRPALLRGTLRFGRGLLLIRVADLDGDGQNEMLVVDADHNVHTPRRYRDPNEVEGPATWLIGSHRFRGRPLGVSFSTFGVFNRKEAIVTSIEEHSDGSVYRELKLTCDGQNWDVAELEHRNTARAAGVGGSGGEIRLIGDSSEPGRVPVLRARPEDGRLWVEILDDRQLRRPGESRESRGLSFLPGEVADLVLCEDELVVAYTRGGLQRIDREGRLRELLFPEWRFVCLAHVSARRLGVQSPLPGSGLLLGGTTFGYVFAMDTLHGGVLWRMDAGFLFSSMTLADAENTGRTDLVLGGIDGSMRIYELTDMPLIDQRCRRLYSVLGTSAVDRLVGLAPATHEAHAAVQLYLLSRVLESTGPAGQAVVDLVRWFTSGQPGWHQLPERAQREAVVTLEHFLLLHLPQLARDEVRATRTGPLPMLTLKQMQSALPIESHLAGDQDTRLLLARTVLAELVEIYLGAPRLVRHQIDRISRRLLEQYWLHAQGTGVDEAASSDSPPPELKRLLSVRSLRAREYAQTLRFEAEQRLRHLAERADRGEPPSASSSSEEHDAVVLRVLRAIGLMEELRSDRFSVETERLDFAATAIDPLAGPLAGPLQQTGPGTAATTSVWPRGCWVVGVDRAAMLRVEPLDTAAQREAELGLSPGEAPPSANSPQRVPPAPSQGSPRPSEPWPWQQRRAGPAVRLPARGSVRFVEVRRLWQQGGVISPAVIVGIDEGGDTRVYFYVLRPDGGIDLRAEARCGGSGAEPIGYEVDPTGREALVLRVPPTSERGRTLVLSVEVIDGQVRAQALPNELLSVSANRSGSLHVTTSRITLRKPGRAPLSAPAPVGACGGALNEGGELLAVGTTTGQVQLFTTEGDSLRLVAQHLFSKGISTLCFLPEGVFGCPALAIGTEDEQIHIIAIDYLHDGQELVRLAVGGTPQRLLCRPLVSEDGKNDGYRLLILLHGGVLASWEAHPQDGHHELIGRLLDLGARASGSRANVLRAAMRGYGPHIRAVAVRELLQSAREGRIAGSILTSGLTSGPSAGPTSGSGGATNAAGAGTASTQSLPPAPSKSSISGPRATVPPPARTSTPPSLPKTGGTGGLGTAPAPVSSQGRAQPERGTPAVSSVLHICRLMCQPDPSHDAWLSGGTRPALTPPAGLPAPSASQRSELHDLSTWPLPRPPRHRLIIVQMLEALVPIALAGSGSGADQQQARLARELCARLVGLCEEPLSVRGDLLQLIERNIRPEHIDDLVGWLPSLILNDSRSAAWPFATDAAAALFLRHLQRLDRAKIFDHNEPLFFKNMVAVLEAVAPTQPSRFLLTNIALLLRSALSWERPYLAGDLARTRLYLPHAVIEAMCQPEILPDPDARAFLLGLSRRWGPRLPTVGAEDLEDSLSDAGGRSESELYWRFEAAVDNGFDQMYYERLGDELSRSGLGVTADGVSPDAWALADIVRGIQRLFDVSNLAELSASLQASTVDKALGPLRAQRSLSAQHLSYRYRDIAWGFFDETAYAAEQSFLSHELQDVDRKTNKAQIAHSLDEVASNLELRRSALRQKLLEQLTAGPPLSHPGAFVARMLAVRPTATVVAVLSVWWQVLVEEATRLRTEPDFEVRLVSDLGVSEGRRVHRHAVILASDAARTAHGVILSVRSTEPKEVRARPLEHEAQDLEPGQELGLVVDSPASIAAEGLRYRVEIELMHDGDKRTVRLVEGQFRREQRQTARALFDSFSERLPTLFQARRDQLLELLKPTGAAVAVVTAFPAHAHELFAEAIGLDWPERPVDTLEQWRMVNVAARAQTPGSGGGQSGPVLARATNPSLRDLIQQVAVRLGNVLNLPSAERLDTAEALLRAISESPVAAANSRGLILLGLPELVERARLDESEQRQLLQLGARICLAYRGRSLVLLSPQAAALSLMMPSPSPGNPSQPSLAGASLAELSGVRHIELLDLDHVADPYSMHRTDDRMRSELEGSLGYQVTAREEKQLSPSSSAPPGSSAVPITTAQTSIRALIDTAGTDLRLIAECLPVVEQALRERSRAPLSPSAFETRVGTYLQPVWSALPLPHKLYLAALCSDSVDLDVSDLRPGMVVDSPVYSISGKDRLPTSKIIAAAGLRLDQRTIDDLSKVMWLKKVRVRGSVHETRSVLWTYLKQPRPRVRNRGGDETARSGDRWLEPSVNDLRRLGLLRALRLGGDKVFYAFTSSAVREWLRGLLGVADGETGLPNTIDGRNLVRQLPLWDAAAVDRALGGNSAQLRAVLGWNRPGVQGLQNRWQDFLDLSRACRKWMDSQDEHRFVEALARYFRLDLVDGTQVDEVPHSAIPMRSVQVRFREKRQLPWLKRVVLYMPAAQPDRPTLEQVQIDLRARLPMLSSGSSGPNLLPRPDAGYAGLSGGDGTISDTSLSAIVVVPELLPEVLGWSRNLFHVAAIDVADLQHAALHDHPVEELIRRLAAAASYAALSPFRSKMGLANQELIEEMFYGRRALLEEIRGQRQENFLIVGPRKIGKTSLLQRVRFELERQGYRVIPRGMDYTTSPSSRELLKAMISELWEDIDPMRAAAGFALGETLPPLRSVVDQWAHRQPDRSIAIVLDEIDTILRTERRAYLLGEWREAWTLGQALATLLPVTSPACSDDQLAALSKSLLAAGWSTDVVDGVLEGLKTPAEERRQSPILEELRSVGALLLQGGAVCRVILAGHAEMVEARWDLFGPLLNFAKLRMLGPLDESSAERMVREPFARLGLRFESANAEQLLLDKTFRVPAWIQHCGALIIQSIDERLRVSRREEQKITERDVSAALEKVHAEERAALQSENGMYMLGPECSFVLLSLVDEPWFTIDGAIDFLHVFFQTLDPSDRKKITPKEEDYFTAFAHEPVRRIIRDLTNTFYLFSDEAEYLTTEGRVSSSAPNLLPISLDALAAGVPGDPNRDRLRKSYKVNRSMVATVFHDELALPKRIELARRALGLWRERRGVWGRSAGK